MISIFFPVFLIVCIIVPLGGQEVGLEKISPHVWVHTSYATVGGVRVGSNGIVIDAPDGAVLVDTCWNDAQTGVLLGLIKRELKKDVILAVVTHVHDDRIGGIRALLGKKIKVVSTLLTAQQAPAAGYPAPKPELNPELTKLSFGGLAVEAFFPGPGHTVDNFTVWVPDDKVLFGGCLIKSMSSKTLGNTADAIVGQWAASVEKLARRYPDAKIVVPGHGARGGRELLAHTIELVKKEKDAGKK